MTPKTVLRIKYLDGETLEYRLPDIQGTRTELAEAIDRARSASNMLLEADGKLVLIPLANVRIMEITPAPDAHPIPGLLMGAKKSV